MKLSTSPIFRLLLAERRFSNAWYILFLTVLLLPPILALAVAPVASDPGVLPSTRAQLTYLSLLLLLFCYYALTSIHISYRQRQRGLRLLWRSMGISDWQVFWQTNFLLLLETGILSGTGLLLCCAWGNPAPGWVATCFQSGVAIWMASAVTLPIAIGLAQRVSSGLAVLMVITFNLGGLYAVPFLDMFRNNSQTSATWQLISEKLWVILPQLSLADQSERITFSWKPMDWMGFGALLLYFAVWMGISFYIGYKLYRRDPVTACLKASE
jgi:hypothetical protein